MYFFSRHEWDWDWVCSGFESAVVHFLFTQNKIQANPSPTPGYGSCLAQTFLLGQIEIGSPLHHKLNCFWPGPRPLPLKGAVLSVCVWVQIAVFRSAQTDQPIQPDYTGLKTPREATGRLRKSERETTNNTVGLFTGFIDENISSRVA